jgi:hypothetical protein
MTDTSRPTADIPAMPDFNSDEFPAASTPAEYSKSEPPPVPQAGTAPVENYGLFNSESQGKLADATQKFVQKLGEYLGQALDDATSLDVRTYVSEDIGAVTYEKGQFSGNARLRAMTRVNIDGDTLVCVPETDGELDTAVWGIHMDMVKQAQESRAELMKTIVSAAGSLASIFTPKG